MLIGVPKEIKNHEYRVGMAPASVREAIKHGHQVLVQANAGEGIGAAADEYASAGAEIVDSAEEIFARADMIVKVKEPQAVERAMLREGQVLFTYLHLAADPEQAKALSLARGVRSSVFGAELQTSNGEARKEGVGSGPNRGGWCPSTEYCEHM